MKRLILAGLLAFSVSGARAEAPAPYRLMRALQEVQNQIAAGKPNARAEQPRMLAEIGRQFAAAPADVWHDARNARAAILLTLSGGSSRVLRQILKSNVFPAEEFKLARGALAYAEGRVDQARQLLVPVDARSLDPALGGQVALIQAALVLAEDREKAIELLGLARLLSPGTLIEETALRRQISLVGETSDAERFAGLARQYSRRFKQSLYAQDFRDAFAASLVRIGSAAAADQAATLEPILATFDSDERCRLAILIARTTLLQGALHSATTFSDMVMRPPVDQGCDVVRARLYKAAARVTDPTAESDLIAIEKLDPARLTADDKALREAALKIAHTVRSWPAAKEPDPKDADHSALRGDPILADAQRLLADSETLLTGKPK